MSEQLLILQRGKGNYSGAIIDQFLYDLQIVINYN
jgi:hypothetical protein